MASIDALLTAVAQAVALMTPEQREAMHKAQRASFARAEAGFGSDADEAEYATAIREGDEATIARLDREVAARVARVNAALRGGR